MRSKMLRHPERMIFWCALLLGICLSPQTLRGADPANPWDPGAEKPCAEALQTALFIQPIAAAERQALQFTVTESAGQKRTAAPVRGSMPFYRGELNDPKQIRLVSGGKEIPVQGLVTSYWPEGTVRWLCLDFLADINAGETQIYTLEFGTKVQPAKRSALKVTEANGEVQINTGKMSVAFSAGKKFSGPVTRTGGGTQGDIRGVLYVAPAADGSQPVEVPLTISEVKLTENGPVQATVYLKGSYGEEKSVPGKGTPAAKYTFHGHVRVYGDSCRMEVIHTFGYNGDENRDFVQRYGLVLPVKAAAATPFLYGGETGKQAEAALAKKLTLTQGRHDWWKLEGDVQGAGKRFGGWAALKNAAGFTTAALRNAWQQWPVTLEAKSDGELALYIYGAPAGESLDLRYEGADFGKSKSMYCGPSYSTEYGEGHGKAQGLVKISELTLDFEADPQEVGGGAHLPLIPFAGAERISQTKALGHIGTYAKSKSAGFDTDGLKKWSDAILDFPVIQHEANGLYGWVDWPDQGDCEPPKDGKFHMNLRGGIGWTNSERALPSYYMHYAAGGAEKYLHLGHAYALHTIGIDLEHPGGDEAVAMQHRHNQVHWRSGGEPRQCGIRGWLADAWMTGHPEIRRILLEVYLPNAEPYGKPIQAGPGPEVIWVCEKDGSLHYPNLLAYLTTREAFWAKHQKGLDEIIFQTASQGLSIPYSPSRGGEMTWKDGKITMVNCKPGKIGGYWITYGGDDRLAEHASLFGYEISLKALRAWGDSYWGATPTPVAGWHPYGYQSPEYGAAAYSMLTKNAAVLQQLQSIVKQRQCKGQAFEWDTFTVKGSAEDWHGIIGQGYGKNGFKIVAANVFESIYALAAIEHAAGGYALPAPPAAVPLPEIKTDTKSPEGTSVNPSSKPEAAGVNAEALAEWNKKLVDRAIAAAKEKARPDVFLTIFGKAEQKVKFAGADAKVLLIEIDKNVLPLSWNKLSSRDRANLAAGLCQKESASDHVLVAVLALADGREQLAEDHFGKAAAITQGAELVKKTRKSLK